MTRIALRRVRLALGDLVANRYHRGLRRHAKALLFEMIRPLIEPAVDSNEDFLCGHCCEPLLRRYLWCSAECEAAFYAEAPS